MDSNVCYRRFHCTAASGRVLPANLIIGKGCDSGK
jgi:hypothetical protein